MSYLKKVSVRTTYLWLDPVNYASLFAYNAGKPTIKYLDGEEGIPLTADRWSYQSRLVTPGLSRGNTPHQYRVSASTEGKGLGMRKTVLTLSALGVAALIAACTPQAVKDVTGNNNPTAIANQAAGTETCMTCHGDSTVLNEKIQNARDSWMTSVHAQGFPAALIDSAGNPIATELEGADSYYANAGACIVCHTKEGFNNNIAGKYPATGPASTDQIKTPSSLTCFTCHKPHTNGNFDLVLAASKSVTLNSGGVYNKSEGSLCASCHQSRTAGGDGETAAVKAAQGGISTRVGPHHGPQADLLLGKDGARYAGKTYMNSAHTTQDKANCITCHMSYPESGTYGFSPNVSGHSFNAVGMVHGAEKANTSGCVTCHTAKTSSTAGLEALAVGAQGALPVSGHLRSGDAYYDTGKSTKHYDTINKLMTALINPVTGKGLLESAYLRTDVATKSITVSADGRGALTFTTSPKFPTATANTPAARFAKAYYNYNYIREDKSFGVHNPTFAAQLLWDSCEDLLKLGATSSVAATESALPARP